jgi:ADP-ribosylglycohydrolase
MSQGATTMVDGAGPRVRARSILLNDARGATLTQRISSDRAAGALVGLAVGDALGAGYEVASAPFTGTAEMIGGGLGGFAPGEWTDDTSMAICVVQVAATGHLAATAVAGRFLDWYRSHPPDVGNQTRDVLSTATHAGEVAARAAQRFARRPNSSAGNGALMRTAPVALAHLGDDTAIVATAHEISALTHADPLSGEACALWCIAIDRAIREQRLDGIRDGLGLLAADRAAWWRERLDEAEQGHLDRFRPNGYVVTALQAAHGAIATTPIPTDEPARHLQDTLHRVIGIGDDTDTTAAIAGQLLGARWGASAIPARWRRMLHGWPGLTGTDLEELAILTVQGGQPEGAA